MSHLTQQAWFYEPAAFDEEEVIEDEFLFDLIKAYEAKERRDYSVALFRFTLCLHESFETYLIPTDWLRRELIRSGSFDSKRQVVFFESVI